MARITLSDYQGGTIPVPDVNRRAVGWGVATKLLIGLPVLVMTGDPWYLVHVGLLAGAVTCLRLPLGEMSLSSRLIDSGIEGSIAAAIGFLLLAPVFGAIYWGIMSSFQGGGEAAFMTLGFLPVELFGRFLLAASSGFMGGVGIALLYQGVRAAR